MSTVKTTPSAVSVSDFIAQVEPAAKRNDAAAIDAMFRRVTGEAPVMWGPSIIGYGSYNAVSDSGRTSHWMRSGFSPRKAKHSFYLMGGYCDDSGAGRRAAQLERLGKHSLGKSCLYINKLDDVDAAVLEEIVAEDWAIMQRLYPQ